MLEAQGVSMKTWRARWPEGRLEPADLRALLTPRTRLVAVTAAANSVGAAPDVAAAAELAHGVGAWLIVDAVHSSPHHLPDVKGWGADFATFSQYKVFGPHLGCLYVRRELLAGLPADKLWFVPDDSPQKFEPGTANHEALAGWLGSLAYLGRGGLTCLLFLLWCLRERGSCKRKTAKRNPRDAGAETPTLHAILLSHGAVLEHPRNTPPLPGCQQNRERLRTNTKWDVRVRSVLDLFGMDRIISIPSGKSALASPHLAG
jgi:hypothetical protein